MKIKIVRIVTLILVSLSNLFMISSVHTLAAACDAGSLTAQQSIQCGANGAAGGNANQTVDQAKTQSETRISDTVKSIINALSVAVGILAIVFIVVGGLRYVASGGKQESVSAAKSTILYAVIGLVVAALAQALVHFVLKQTT